jgi:propionate CoA-transferase
MQFVSAQQAVQQIPDGATVACAGFVGVGHAEAVTRALEERFLASAAPRDLTLVFSAGQGDGESRGVNHFGNVGMTRRIVGGHWRSAPRLSQLALAGEAEAYNLPQGVISHLYRAIAGGKPGVLTPIGLHTFVDPRRGGARLNEASFPGLPAPNRYNAYVRHVEFEGAEYLFYPSFPIHVALMRATSVDANGNLSCEDEPFHHELLALAQAARNSGGIVIAQVKRVVERHAQIATVRVPGILVDFVVVCDDPELSAMTFGEAFNPSYLCAGNGTNLPLREPSALDARKIVQRRAVLELARQRPRVVNLGVGMPAMVGAVAHEEGVDGFTLTVEAGPIGGVPADGFSFGASAYPEAVVDQPAQFDFYEGGGIDMAFLGLAELDQHGNVNVSKFGSGEHALIAGVGGFINITQSARTLVFMGTLTANGLEVATGDGRLSIVREGSLRKVVREVSHLSFNGPYVASLGRDILYVTERAVFAMRDARLTLIEVAPGIDLESQVLAECDCDVAVAHDLKLMDAAIFRDAPMLV